MIVSEILEAEDLKLVLRAGGDEGRLRRAITWCAPTEHIDPAPFLSVNALLLTTGMGMNIRDQRTWDAYVERLNAVPISALAFGVGSAHRELPAGLLQACESYGVPLLEVPAEVPFIRVMRYVEQTLAAERYSVLRRGWEMADACARLAAVGGTLGEMVEHIAHEASARVAVVDRDGFELLSSGPLLRGKGKRSRTLLRMPGGEDDTFRLLVEVPGAEELLQPLLGPVAAVLAMQLAHTLGGKAPLHSVEAARLVDALYAPAAPSEAELAELAREAGFDSTAPWCIVIVRALDHTTKERLRAVAWRIRVGLARTLSAVRFVESPGVTTILAQGQADERGLLEAATELLGQAAGIAVAVKIADEAADLPLLLRIAARSARTPGVHRAPAIDLSGILESLPDMALASLSRRLLEPLGDEAGSALRKTLESYLRHAGSTAAVCEELFIHRNTLAYRIRRLEELLGADLSDGEVRASLLLALKFLAA
ncbi:PucR family transcriptional regulator [Sinomonas sp. ASV322]|uniref:PucR family transcriptional regulator n=1 Tax=Sinomonas sp. ASV322 TaxID=3041920 RepID=UPI0027DC91EA|nr:PucR family transcriptional regulator [Sinomonas sp. ASV322]MDQ4504237.1 PucR family transcriptional regulator [Sinomonas sp. ASV322]